MLLRDDFGGGVFDASGHNAKKWPIYFRSFFVRSMPMCCFGMSVLVPWCPKCSFDTIVGAKDHVETSFFLSSVLVCTVLILWLY